MADYTVLTGQVGVHEIALAANTELTVEFQGGDESRPGPDLSAIEVTPITGTAPVYFCFNSPAATVKGAHCIPAFVGVSTVGDPKTSGTTVVRLISAAAAVVTVMNAG